MSDFKREERYIVVKLKDIDAEETEAFREFLQSWQIPTRECVVVESYWPNYEDTWKSVEQVANGEYQSPYDLIEQLQQRITELEAQLKEREWISVDDQLPEYPDEVLCITSSEVLHICKFCQLSRLWMKGISCERMYTVTHWMPLPQPPKEKDNG